MQAKYQDGEPCDHKGCLSHITKRCEGCGRIGGINDIERVNNCNHDHIDDVECKTVCFHCRKTKKEIELEAVLKESQRLYQNSINLACDFDKRREEEMRKRIALEKQVERLIKLLHVSENDLNRERMNPEHVPHQLDEAKQ